MDTYEQQEVKRYYFPYLIAHGIGYIIGIGELIMGESFFIGVVSFFLGAPFAALLFRSIIAFNRMLNSLLNGLFQMGCFTWLIGIFASFLCVAGGMVEILKLVNIYPISLYLFIIFLDLISVSLLYTDIRHYISGTFTNVSSKLSVTIVLISALLILAIVGVCIHAKSTDKYKEHAQSKASTVEILPEDPMDVSFFSSSDPQFVSLCDIALAGSRLEEDDDKENYKITSPSRILAAYYLEAKDPAAPHKDYGHNISLNNAVVIQVNYHIYGGHHPTIDREECSIWVFPNFVINDDGMVNYGTEEIHTLYLGSNTVQEAFDWLTEEYDDMVISAIPISSK